MCAKAEMTGDNTYIVLFHTHSGAIKFNRRMTRENIACQLMPVPRALSSNCSIAATVSYAGGFDNLIGTEVEKIFLEQNGETVLVYEEEQK